MCLKEAHLLLLKNSIVYLFLLQFYKPQINEQHNLIKNIMALLVEVNKEW